MIVVEIPAALAADPQVVPVDRFCPQRAVTPPGSFPAFDCPHPEHEHGHILPSLIGQRVALAWRETCPTCEGSRFRKVHGGVFSCSSCGENGERIVVGWTAEVAEAIRVLSHHPVSHWIANYVLALPYGTAQAWIDGSNIDLPAADWSPGRYALVLRDRWPFGPTDDDCPWTPPSPCRLFSGFAELDEVLR